jgi:hypothetical protein
MKKIPRKKTIGLPSAGSDSNKLFCVGKILGGELLEGRSDKLKHYMRNHNNGNWREYRVTWSNELPISLSLYLHLQD